MSRLALFKLAHDTAREGAASACQSMPAGTVVEFKEPTRSLEQNAKMWAMLQDIASQVDWQVDGVLRKLSKEEWKAIVTAGVKRSQKIALGIEGGFVVLPDSTSNMSIRDMKAVIEFAQFFGDSNQVQWTDPKPDAA